MSLIGAGQSRNRWVTRAPERCRPVPPLGPKNEFGKVLVSVKGGKSLNPGMVRDLGGTVNAQKAAMGVLITREPITAGMRNNRPRRSVHPPIKQAGVQLSSGIHHRALAGEAPEDATDVAALHSRLLTRRQGRRAEAVPQRYCATPMTGSADDVSPLYRPPSDGGLSSKPGTSSPAQLNSLAPLSRSVRSIARHRSENRLALRTCCEPAFVWSCVTPRVR